MLCDTGTLTRTEATLRLGATGIVFIGVYALCNQLTHLRGDAGRAVFDWERAIPFVPWTIVPYLSLIGFFALSFLVRRERAQLDCHVAAVAIDLCLSATCYLLMPLRFNFDRPMPDGVWGLLFGLLGATDLPYNRAPSLHISLLLIVWLRLAPQWEGWKKAAFGIWFVLIALSVLTTYQHHVIDVPAGLLVGAASVALARRIALPRFEPGLTLNSGDRHDRHEPAKSLFIAWRVVAGRACSCCSQRLRFGSYRSPSSTRRARALGKTSRRAHPFQSSARCERFELRGTAGRHHWLG
jgi:membrane-associated phospholipid phosphatase